MITPIPKQFIRENKNKNMKKYQIQKTLLAGLLMVSLLACKKEEEVEEVVETEQSSSSDSSWTITVGAYSLSNGVYTDLGNELVFDSQEECQTWSRTAQGDAHDANAHQHYNAAANVSFVSSSTTFTWTEYGPEVSQSAIETTCANGANGVTKTVNNNSYYQDKPNVYLKIKSAVEN